jgi:hypothetical protein
MTNRSNAWTAERRALQSLLIHRWRPWEHATGPQSAAGKAIASRNAARPDSIRAQLRALAADLRTVRRMVNKAVKVR